MPPCPCSFCARSLPRCRVTVRGHGSLRPATVRALQRTRASGLLAQSPGRWHVLHVPRGCWSPSAAACESTSAPAVESAARPPGQEGVNTLSSFPLAASASDPLPSGIIRRLGVGRAGGVSSCGSPVSSLAREGPAQAPRACLPSRPRQGQAGRLSRLQRITYITCRKAWPHLRRPFLPRTALPCFGTRTTSDSSRNTQCCSLRP